MPVKQIKTMSSMKNKVVVVSGASSGLGRSIAVETGNRRMNVAVLARRQADLKTLRASISAAGGECIDLPTDVSRPKAVDQAFKKIDSYFGQIDVLFNCAGAVEPIAPLVQASDQGLLNALMTNVFGIYLTTRAALKRMLNQEHGGTILNIGSGAAHAPYAGWSAYCSQKGALAMFTRCVAMEVSHRPVRIVAISPGPFESHMQKVIRQTDSRMFPAREKFVKLYQEGKLAEPQAVAKVMVDIALTDWPELSGRVEDLRSADFQRQCIEHGLNPEI